MRENDRIIGNAPSLNEALEQISRLAPIPRPVLVLGERGTGKELAAARLHYLSPRWDEPFLKLNCAAVSESLLESEIFGHEPGAFTGASRTHQGRLERADGGTLFLDELGTMSTGLQEKLLRVIEYGEFERLGGQTTLSVNVRVIAATNADLKQQAAQGHFREDLLDRLSFDVVHLPPLRHRLSDIPELAHHFAVQMCAELGREFFPGFSDRAARQLLQHRWPGNVRELKNTVERSVARWTHPKKLLDAVIIDPFASPFEDWTSDTPASGTPPSSARVSNTAPLGKPLRFRKAVADYEKSLLRDALSDQQGHQGNTARALGLSYDQLRGLLKKHNLLKSASRAKTA
ncbi:MAG: phage shock protein operon transcriptional activator [Pseudomonadota bacterium]